MRRFLEKIAGFGSKNSGAAAAAKSFVLAGNASLTRGDLNDAVTNYQKALEIDPENANVCTNLGFALKEMGEFDAARAHLEKALQINPRLDDVHHMLAQLAELKGDLNAACNHLDSALAINANSSALWCDLCRVSFSAGKVESARRAALLGLSHFPDTPDLHMYLGNIWFTEEKYAAALISYEKALRLAPDSFELHRSRGLALYRLEKFEEALESYATALRIQPDHADAHYERANTYQQLARTEEALECYAKVITLVPGHVGAHYNSGNCASKLGRTEQALAYHDRCISLSPDFAEAHMERGNALWKLLRLDDALKSFEHAIALKPDYDGAYINRGLILQSLMRPSQAMKSFEKAIAISPDNVTAHWNESLLRLSLGEMEVGWAKYEWRRKKPENREFDPYLSLPLWLGKESLQGKTILLHAEQGLGDAIQFYRYVAKVSAQGAKVILVVPPALHQLIAQQEAPITTISAATQITGVDFQCSLMSLPLAFRTTLDQIDGDAYLRVPSEALGKWRQKMGESERPRVCIVWRGSPGHGNDANRSINLTDFRKLLCPGIDYFTVQFNLNADEQQLLSEMNVRSLAEEIEDFTDTAAIIALADLVITVDTSVAHLAGALGKKVFVLLPFAPDWRWLFDRPDSPWYRSARLFRQPSLRNWDDVFPRVKLETQRLFQDTTAGSPQAQGTA